MTDIANELTELRHRLEEAEATLTAIRCGEVDALVVSGAASPRIYTLQGADHPYRVLVEAMQQGAITLSNDRTIVYCNSSFADMVNRPYDKIVGQKAEQFFCASDRPALLRLLESASEGRRQKELCLSTHGGADLPVLVSFNVLPLEDQAAVCLVVTDLTEHRQNQLLRDSDRKKDEFLAMLAHELRNPLAPISNAVEMLSLAGQAEGDSPVSLACSIIRRQVVQLTRLVDDLLDVSRITRGKINLHLVPLDVATIVTSAIETSRPLIESRRHALRVQLNDEPLYVLGDAVRLSQVVTNLLNNAAKYTEDGGQVELRVERAGSEAVIRIRDNGAGLSPEMLSKVFELFTQADRTIDRAQGGLGIGLTLVKSLVEMHRGSVDAASDGLGCGSEFTLRLPLAGAADSPLVPASQPHAAAAAGKSARRILIIDDNIDAAKTLAGMVTALGHEAETAFDGSSGIDKAFVFQPKLVLLDIGLPGMNGFSVARQLRQAFERSKLAIVALSGYSQEHQRQLSAQADFDSHLVKPLSLQQLQTLLASIS